MGPPDTAQIEQALALAQQRLESEPSNPQVLGRVGSLLAVLGRPAEAVPFLERAVTIDPTNPEMVNNLGATLRAIGRGADAIPLLRRAVEIAPGYDDARYNLAGVLAKSGAYAEAIPHYERLLAGAPESPQIQNALARSLWKADRLDEAIAAHEALLARHPDFHLAYADYGNALKESGRLDEAVAAHTRAIELAPHVGAYYRYLADTRAAAVTDEHLAALEALVQSETLTDDDRIDANFALGRIYGERGDQERAFRHLLAANSQRRSFIDYDEHATLQSFEHIAQTFSPDFIRARDGCSHASSLPIFILGMPRSGTTLVEQILASHPAVYGAGELPLFQDTADAVIADGRWVTMQEMCDATCEQLREIGRRYIERLQNYAPAALRITDKMPANFRLVGLIQTVLPGTRIIHTKRTAVDTCVSCFSQNFAGEQPWAYDLAELGRYYRGYERLMAHWRDVLAPDAMLEVQYEDVVDDLETQARRIIAFCGLDWNDACLRFYETQRPVRTASATQVRRPIYRTSVDRSRVYGDLLLPLTEALNA